MTVELRTLADYQGFTLRAFCQACDRSIALDQPALIARFGAEVLLDTIRHRLRCRQCGRRPEAFWSAITMGWDVLLRGDPEPAHGPGVRAPPERLLVGYHQLPAPDRQPPA